MAFNKALEEEEDEEEEETEQDDEEVENDEEMVFHLIWILKTLRTMLLNWCFILIYFFRN